MNEKHISESDVPIIHVDPTLEQIAEWDAYNAAAYEREIEAVKQARHAAYIAPDGSDALYMKWQRNEDGATKEAWLARIAEINEANPYPEPPVK